MTSPFTLGIEEEFQMVNWNTNRLVSYIHTLLDQATPLLGEHVKAEMLQCCVELSTRACPDVATLRLDLREKITTLAHLLAPQQIALVRAGTHPLDRWQDQRCTQIKRYKEHEEDYQDAARSLLIFGLHIHVGLEDQTLAIPLINQLRTWLPHLLALSSNAPFWAGRNSGTHSYRTIIWKRLPRTGIPEIFASSEEFDNYVSNLIACGCIDNAKKIWWDIRPHPFYNTIEFRICDMPATMEDSIALAALCQALVAKLAYLYHQGIQTPLVPHYHIEENKWRAIRYGMDAQIIDFTRKQQLPIRESISELLDFVDDVVDELHTRSEMRYLRALLTNPYGTGSQRQLATYHENQNAPAVARYLVQTALEESGITTTQMSKAGTHFS